MAKDLVSLIENAVKDVQAKFPSEVAVVKKDADVVEDGVESAASYVVKGAENAYKLTKSGVEKLLEAVKAKL